MVAAMSDGFAGWRYRRAVRRVNAGLARMARLELGWRNDAGLAEIDAAARVVSRLADEVAREVSR